MYEEPQQNATYRCTLFINGIVKDKSYYKYSHKSPSGRWYVFVDIDTGKNHLTSTLSFPVQECTFDRNIKIKSIFSLLNK